MFEYEGTQFSLQDLKNEAVSRGLELGDFIKKMEKLGMTHGSNATDKGLNLDVSSQQPFGQDQLETDDEIGFFEGIGISFQNKPAEAKGYWYKAQLAMAPYIELMGGPDAARAWLGDFSKESMGKTGFLDPETNNVVSFNNEAYDRDGHDADENKRYYELVKLRQSVPRYEENPVKIIDVASGKNIEDKVSEEAQEKFKQSLENQKNIRKISDSEGFLDAVKSGEVGDAIVHGSDFIAQTAMQAVLARVTGGTSMMGIMYGDAYTTFNDEKSKLLYGENDPDRFKKLIENDEDQIAIPAALGGLGYLMERAGYKGMMKEMAKRSFTGKTAVGLLATGNKEGLTEYGQGLTERLNLNLGKGMDLEDAVIDVSKYMWTEQAWENYFAGLIGGVGVGGGGKAVNAALRYDETSNQFINEKIKTINGLLELKAKTTNKKKRKNLEDLIQIQEVGLKEYLDNNNKISQYLSGRQKKGLIDLLNQKREARKELQDIFNLHKKGILSNTELDASKSEIDSRIERYDDGMLKIKNDANMSLLMQDLDASGSLVKDIKNLEQLVYKTPAEFLAAVKAEYLAQGKTEKEFEQATKNVSIDGIKVGNKLLINAKVAAEKNAFGTGTHEILHGILKSTLQADDGSGNLSLKGESIVKDFVSKLSSKQKKLIEERLKSGNYKFNKDKTEKEFKEYGEEYLNFYAQLSKEGKFSLNAIQKAGQWLSSFYRTNSEFKKLGFENGEQTKAFLDAFVTDSKNGIYRKEFTELAKEGVGMKGTSEFSKDQTSAVNELAEMGWDNKSWKEQGADFAIKEMQSNKMLDGLIRSKYKADIVPDNFVDLVYSELVNHVKNFKPEQNDNLFGWINSQIANKAGNVYNREFKVADEMKGAKDIGKTTKEGEVKVQVAAEKSAEMEAFEEEDLSIQGQAKKAKADKQRYSEYRRKLGFETGSKIYNEVLDNVKKSLMMAYGTTQNITDVQLRAQAIAAKLKKEYANLNSPLFKQIKNFLTYGVADTKVPYGTKDIYISQLRKLREDIVKNTSTADLVQMERNTPEADRIFTNFVKVLTSIEQVQDAVNREQLPPDALNKITKDKKTGKGAFSPSLYNKIMPTETELVSWADQPGINPVTGARQGLKGTRKDGIAMRMVNGLVTDAIMEARQSEEVQSKIAEMDIDPGSVAELGAAIGREVNVKFSKSNAIGDISAAIDGAGDVNVYSQIKFSKSHREAYEKQLTKKRPDLTEDQRKNAVQSVFDFVDGKEIPNNKKSKYEKMAMHYTANGHLILPEDGYKVIEAERLAAKNKVDPFSVKDPNALMQAYVEDSKSKRTDPDKVKTFSNKTEYSDGVVVYDVEDSKKGQLDVRKVADTHFGPKFQNWCLIHRDKRTDQQYGNFDNKQEAERFADEWRARGYEIEISLLEKQGEYEVYADLMTGNEKTELNEAFDNWEHYNTEGNGHKIAFHNGKLLAFRDGNEMSWWDINDNSTDAPVVRGKKDKDGFKPVSLVYKNKSEVIHQEKVTGNKKNGTTIRKDLDGNLVFQETKKNGKTDGLNIEVDNKHERSNNYKFKRTQNFKEGNRLNFKEERTYSNPKATEKVSFGRDEIRVDNITKHERSFTEKDWVEMAETITIEGTVNQRYFEEFQDPSKLVEYEKTNLKYQTPTHERYYGIQGKKVKIVKTTKRVETWSDTKIPRLIGKTEDVTVTIDGEVQETRVRFSKSDANYSKAQNAVKFSKMSSEAKTKLSVKIGVMQRNISEEETSYQLLGVILDNIIKFETYQEFYNTTVKDIRGIYNENEAVQVGNVLLEGVFNESHLKKIIDIGNKPFLKEVREISVGIGLEMLGNRIKNLTDKEQQGSEIVSYIKGDGRSIRSGQLKGIRTNMALFDKEIKKLLINDFLQETIKAYTFNGKDGRNKTAIKYKGEKITTFLHPSTIKRVTLSGNQNNINEVRQTMFDEAGINLERMFKEFSDPKIKTWEKLASLEVKFLDQMGELRKSYPPGGHMVGRQYDSNNTTLEHNPPVKMAREIWKQFIMGKIEEKDVRNWYADNKASVNVISNKLNDVLAAEGLSQKSSEGQNRYEHPNFVSHPDYKNFKFSKSLSPDLINKKHSKTLVKAVQFSRSTQNPTKGITVLDFDDTLATSKSMIRFTRPDGTKGKLNAEQYASTYEDLSELGYKWDFSEFNKVVDGKTAPLFNKAMKLQGKFGPENMFVLTARPAESAAAIHAFLKANGLNIPLKNITGLANSTAEAKALWVAEKVGEGYNDFYFADDALQNVKAVQSMLDQFDVKSKVQQARVKFSKNMNTEFNKVLERTTGVDANEIISGARAAKRGASKGKYKFFVPPSADDFKGLLYYFVGKGKQGEKDMAFLKKALTDPLNRAYTEFNAARQSIANDYRNLKKQMPDVKNKLLQKTPDGDFTYGDAVRVYLWNKAGFDVPGLNQKDVDNLVEMVTSDPQLMMFAYKLGKISKRPEGYTNPTEHWQIGDIRNDLADATGRVGRKEFFAEFIENVEKIFGKMVNGKLTGDNINKIEAIYGSNFREALEDILYATYTGSSRPYGSNRMVNGFTNWINGSVGATMFVNMRSALLQQMSSVNFLNWGDNNIFKAGKAFANFPQYIKDWAMIFNSDKLKQRRSGLSMDINANELATYLGKSKSKPAALLSWLLQKGFLPTQISDSIAIANGGAGFYRNRVNTYLKQGFKQKEAEEKAWNDFSEIAEETQQSARPDMVSQQQRSPIGKWFLNFLNTPMQYSRIMKKAMLDLVNRRGDAKTHISRIIYYGAAQNAIFYTLQTGLFAAMFGLDDEDEESQKFFDTKAQMTANSMVDGLLKGLGFGGAAISTVKNMIIKFIEEDRKGYKGKPAKKVTLEMVNFSPVVGIKVRKISSAIDRYSWDKDIIKHMETFDIDNPIWGISTGIVEGATNVPLNRLYRKVQNVRAAADADREAWQRLALVSGWSVWNIGEQNEELEKLKDEIKARKKKNKKKSKSNVKTYKVKKYKVK